jgi:hypothetical protein
MSSVVIAILVIWFCASVVGQFATTRLGMVLARCPFVPRWSFFAPTPGTLDVRLYYRDKFPDGSLTIWTTVNVSRRGRCACVWNPHRRLRKALFDLSQAISRPQVPSPDDHNILRVPYLVLLAVVVGEKHWPGASMVQFALVVKERLTGGGLPEELFRSRFHILE